MKNSLHFAPGSLVRLYDRPYIVLPSEGNKELLRFKPLGGKEEEIMGVYLPLHTKPETMFEAYIFPLPAREDLGDWNAAKLLYNAARFSFRDVAGPFRVLGRIAFRPRAYQMAPLVMALKQEKAPRLLIADDVGVGKTIEGMLIAYELYLRKEIDRFAVLCPPHLCNQWQYEIESKLGIPAPILRSGTAAALEKKAPAFQNIFTAFPCLVVSIDYVKMPDRKQNFLDNAPPLLIVDEAHTAARPALNREDQMQQRYALLQKLAENPEQSLLLLTATPHSGKEEEFQSLLGLLRPEWEKLSFTGDAPEQKEQKKELARFFIQRRRADVLKWLEEKTEFPVRKSFDLDYNIADDYNKLFNEILKFTRSAILEQTEGSPQKNYRYWEAIALLKSLMSSPKAGVAALRNKAKNGGVFENVPDFLPEPDLWDEKEAQDDSLPFIENFAPASNAQRLLDFARRLEELENLEHDAKAKNALDQIEKWLEKGLQPVVFCHYIQTAIYLGELLKEPLLKKFPNLHIEVVTGELDDEQRKEKIERMAKSPERLLIATDCLSEGINLQEGFNALLHYDLPWNPNRLEQREGRIDRFGQKTKTVEIALLYGANNPMDGVILDVLLRKAREIRQSTGISVPFPENSASVLKALTGALLLRPEAAFKNIGRQLTLIDAPEVDDQKTKIAKAFDEVEKREKTSRSIFAQNAIKVDEIEKYLKASDKATGQNQDVEAFCLEAFRYWGCEIKTKKAGEKTFYQIDTNNAPDTLLDQMRALNNKNKNKTYSFSLAFEAPPPEGAEFIGRNHPLIENLSLYLLHPGNANEAIAARAAVIRTRAVEQKTALLLLRLRALITRKKKDSEWLAEEVALWGYRAEPTPETLLSPEQAENLFFTATPAANITPHEAQQWIADELEEIQTQEAARLRSDFAAARAQNLAQEQNELRKILGAAPYSAQDTAVPEILGLYILLPIIE